METQTDNNYDDSRWLTIPNVLSITRICLTPLFVVFILTERYRLGLIFILYAGLSDTLDGQIARRFNQGSKYGKILDPVADKVLGVSAFVTLSLVNLIPPWLGALVFTRDISIGMGASILLLLDMQVMSTPSVWGKANTAVQIATIIAVLLGTFESMEPYMHGLYVVHVCIFTMASLTLISGIDYLAKALKAYEEGALLKPVTPKA